MWFIISVVAIIALVLVWLAIRVIWQYEHGIVFRFGRLVGVRNPGFNLIWPIIDRMIKVDMRVITMVVEPQEVITKDNVTIKVDAVVYFQVVTPASAVVKVLDYIRATSQIAQTTLRSVLGQSELDELLAHREEINQRLRTIIDEQTEPWGVKVTLVEVKDVQLPETMQRAMAKQAEAEREKRAKIIHAQGEYQAAQTLAEAAAIMTREPAALQLRYMQTLTEMAGEKNSTIIPLPIDILGSLIEKFQSGKASLDKVLS
ncbi:MAG: SPFH domain-containing protein [Chloroflexi bacterium]|nr:SPFH domain-containing protein [Chloroflexota bacterium]